MGSADRRDDRAHAAIQATRREAGVEIRGMAHLRRTPGQEIADEDYIETIRTIAVGCHNLPGPVEDAAQRLSYTCSTAGKEKHGRASAGRG
jgi:hypothetical protein